jgi:eukaryotic-like serine/threonine-protein kinase
MGVDEPRAAEDKFLSSLSRYHESLSVDTTDGAPPELPPDADPELSARLKRAHECLRLLHVAWGDDKSDSRPTSQDSSFSLSSFSTGEPLTRVGRFEIVRELGRGAFGIVFLAFDPALDREVALKVPRPEALVTPQLRRRFLREAQAAASVNHPNLVSVFEWGEWGPICYIATEYCDGPTLEAWLQQRIEPVPLATAATLVATLATALDYAHDHGIIHRDLKPSNVMLVPKHGSDSVLPSGENDGFDFLPKIADFGLAKLLASSLADTRSGAILGTPAYMAPEQVEGRLGKIGRQTDVHGLGAILYEMLTGRPPFSGATDVETLKRVALDEPAPPRGLRACIPRDLEAICLKCLEKQPSRRYPTAAALADDLARFLAFRPTQARPHGPLRRSLKWARRRPLVTALLGIMVVIGLSGSASQWWHAASLRKVLDINARIRTQAEQEQRASLAQLALVQHQNRRVWQYRYAADVASALAAWRSARVAETLQLLERHRPQAGEEDRRSFAWHYLWRLCHAERLTLRGHKDSVYSVTYSLDGKRLATTSKDKTARIWDAETGRELATFRGHGGDVNRSEFSPDGRLLATAADDRTVRLWNVSPPSLRATCLGHTGLHIYSVAFSPDGKTLASAGEDHVVKLWDTATARERRSLEGRNGSIKALAFSPDGNLLATAASDGTCQLWDMRTGRTRFELNSRQGNIAECVSFSHDGRSLASGGEDRKIRIWDTVTGAEKATLSGHFEVVLSLSFAPDDRTLAAAVKDGSVWRWDLATGKPLNILVGHTKRVCDVKFSPDGRTLATASADGTVKLWDADADQTHKTISGLATPPAILAFSADSNQLAAAMPGPGDEGATFRAWDVRTGVEHGSHFHLDGRLGGTTSSNGKAFVGHVTIHRDGLGIRVITANDRRWFDTLFVLNPLPSDRPVAMSCLTISPDGRMLATGHSHGKVEIWGLGTGRQRATMNPEKSNDVCAIRFSPDGEIVASATLEGTVRLWDVESGAIRATLSGHLGSPLAIEFSLDGTHLATASADRTVKMWSTATGAELATLQRHSGEVRTIAFSPDGKTLASGSEDGALKLWDVATCQELLSLDAHRGGVRFVAFSPDGSVLASSGGTDDGRGEVFLWTTAPNDH